MATPINASAGAGGTSASGTSPNIITALGHVFKQQTGDTMSDERIAQMLIANMGQIGELAKQGKLNRQQITQLKDFAEKHVAGSSAALNIGTGSANTAGTSNASASSNNAQAAAGAKTTTTQQQQSQEPQQTSQAAAAAAATGGAAAQQAAGPSGQPVASLLTKSGAQPLLSGTPTLESYPTSQTLTTTNPGPVTWPSAQQGRPTLTGGIPGGRVAGTPAQIARGSEDAAMLNLDDSRTRRKNTPGEQSMRRSIQDLVASVDPNVKIEPEVEDLLLSIADEFIDSVTHFGCRLAKHRGGDTLEVRDLQLHLERNHNIRIPGFASDETRISLSQSTITPPVPPVAKKAQQGTHMTLRSHRLAAVQQAKREGKLI